MPFKSEKQRKWMWANEPAMAQRWANEEKRGRKRKPRRIKSKMLRR
tara:strand:+ start:118 stop:255 length:138 start_codon:yes stop_codon:yes gene_type:complete